MRKQLRREQGSPAHHRLKRTLGIFLVISIWVGWVAFLYKQKLFRITEVSCQSEQGSCSEAVSAELNHLKDEWLFSNSIGQTQQKILQSDTTIESLKINRRFPSQLNVQLSLADPVLLLKCVESKAKIPNENQKLAVMADGKTRLLLSDAPVPNLFVQQKLCDQFLEKGVPSSWLSSILHFTDEGLKTNGEMKLYWEDEYLLTWNSLDNREVRFTIEHVMDQLKKAEILLKDEALPPNWKIIDLRFRNAVVTVK